MFLLDPVNSITSVRFYKKVSAQSGLRTAGYLGYLALVFAVLATVAFKVRLGPTLDTTWLWLQTNVPTLVFTAGKVTAPDLKEPVAVRHPTIPELSVQIDPSRTEPVTPQMMDQLKVKAFLAQSALYLMDPQGQVKVNDFSKSAVGEKPIRIDAAFFRSAQGLLSKVLYPLTLLLAFAFFLLWKAFSTLFYTLVGMAVNAIADTKLSFSALINIAVYAQTLIIAIQCIFLFMKAPLPLASLISLGATTAYIWLAVKAAGTAEPAASA